MKYALCMCVHISVMVSTVIAGNNVLFARLGMLAPGIDLIQILAVAKYDISVKYGCVNGFLFIVYDCVRVCMYVLMWETGHM